MVWYWRLSRLELESAGLESIDKFLFLWKFKLAIFNALAKADALFFSSETRVSKTITDCVALNSVMTCDMAQHAICHDMRHVTTCNVTTCDVTTCDMSHVMSRHAVYNDMRRHDMWYVTTCDVTKCDMSWHASDPYRSKIDDATNLLLSTIRCNRLVRSLWTFTACDLFNLNSMLG